MKLSGETLGMICTKSNILVQMSNIRFKTAHYVYIQKSCVTHNAGKRGREHLKIQTQIQIHLQLQIQIMQAMEEENLADNINGEVEERVRSDSAASGNHENDAFDEILSQGWDEQDAFKHILFQNFIHFGRVRFS